MAEDPREAALRTGTEPIVRSLTAEEVGAGEGGPATSREVALQASANALQDEEWVVDPDDRGGGEE